jgi:hypothetical protein
MGKKDECPCGWGRTRGGKYRLILVNYMPIKMLEVPIAEIMTQMTQVSTEDMIEKHCNIMGASRNFRHRPVPYSETLLGKLETLKRNAGICIDSVRGDGAAEL